MLATLPAAAQEFVRVPEPLSDRDFYRAVACAAPPGGDCRKPFLRWPEAARRPLAVGLAALPEGLPASHAAPFDAGLDAAIAEVNAAGADIALRRDDDAPDIRVHVVTTPPGGVIADTGEPMLDGTALPLALVLLRAREQEITEALVAVSIFAPPDEVPSLLLEEVVQALGLMTDGAGPAYATSLFAEDGNAVDRLRGQDAMALRRHYPKD
jgi:hypothetical protein